MALAIRGSALGNNGQSAASATIAFTVPASAVTGDIAWACIVENGVAATVSTVPTGWTLYRGLDAASTTFGGYLYYKVMPGTVGSTSTDASTAANWVLGTSVKTLGLMVVVSGNSNGRLIDIVTSANSVVANTVLTAPAITTSIQNDLILEFLVGHTATTVNTVGTVSANITNIAYSSTNYAAAPNLSIQAVNRTVNPVTPGVYGSDTCTYTNSNNAQLTYSIAIPPPFTYLAMTGSGI